MERAIILLVTPAQPEESDIACTISESEYNQRFREFLRLRKVLKTLGFNPTDPDNRDKSFICECEGCNWEAKAVVEPFFISNTNLKVLEGKAEELVKLRDQALDKLTIQEQVALGILYTDYDIPHKIYDYHEQMYKEFEEEDGFE